MRSEPVFRLIICAAAAGLTLTWQMAAAQPSPVAGVPSPADRPIPAGVPVALELEEAVALTLRDNRSIRSARLQRAAERFDLFVVERTFTPEGRMFAEIARRESGGVEETEAILAPGIGWLAPLGTTVTFDWQRREPLGSGTGNPAEATSLTIRQPLLRGGGLDVNLAPVRIARLQDRINRLGLEAAVADTVTSTIFAYRALAGAQEQVRLAELSLERARALLETNRALIEAGRMAAADIVQTESAVANLEVAFLQAQQERTSAQLALLQLLALDPRTNVVAASEIDAERTAIDLGRAIELALAARVDVLGQKNAVEQARHALLIARNARLWDVSLFGAVTQRNGLGGFVDGFDDLTDHQVGLRVEIPIGDVAARQRVIRARTNVQIAELRYKELNQAVETQVRDAVQQVEIRWRQVEAARRARVLAASALELQQEKLRVGRASNFEVLSFQADLRAADIQELSASIAYLNALTALDRQIGSTLDTWRIVVDD